MTKIKVKFAPGAFDSFEGTQEELDALVQEITQTLSNMDPEKLSSNSVQLDDSELEELINTHPEILNQSNRSNFH